MPLGRAFARSSLGYTDLAHEDQDQSLRVARVSGSVGKALRVHLDGAYIVASERVQDAGIGGPNAVHVNVGLYGPLERDLLPDIDLRTPTGVPPDPEVGDLALHGAEHGAAPVGQGGAR